MANFRNFGTPAYAQELSLRVTPHSGSGVGFIRIWVGEDARLNLRTAEAVKLRDDLSRAIVEAAQASAEAKTVESEGSPA